MGVIHLGKLMRNFLFFVFFSLSFGASAAGLAEDANSNPFLNGELNPKYEGQLTALSGDIIEIIEGHENRKLYKLHLNIEGVKPVWVTSLAPFAKGDISMNSKLIFRGYIATSDSLDSTGRLKSKINSETLLLALKADLVK